jgi:hypothetical protein
LITEKIERLKNGDYLDSGRRYGTPTFLVSSPELLFLFLVK